LDGDDAVLVELDAVEDEVQELALGAGVGLVLPEERKVGEHLVGVVEVGDGGGREGRKLGVDGAAAGDVFEAGGGVGRIAAVACRVPVLPSLTLDIRATAETRLEAD
jgi:hypothetical protein